jgi:hypothetical protein
MKTNWIAALVLTTSASSFAQNLPDLEGRSRIIRESFKSHNESLRVKQLLWLVQYSPEADILGETCAAVSRPGTNYEALKAAWSQQIYVHPTPEILANAANFFRPLEPQRAIELYLAARSMEPANRLWVTMLSELFAAQIVEHARTAEGARMKAALLHSDDRDLAAAVARALDNPVMIAAVRAGQQEEVAAFVHQLRQVR